MDPGRDRFSAVKWLLIVQAALLVSSLLPLQAAACTLWAAAGERTAGGGVLIAKNRDWTPEADEIRLAALANGRRFVGLFPLREGSKRPSAVAGISEKGLVFVTATASSVPPAQREKGKTGLAGKVLSEFESVGDVLKSKAMFSQGRPAIYLLADRERIAWIEVAPGGHVAVQTTESGMLSHTNHYLADELSSANIRIGRSSASRLARIGQLLSGGPPRLSPEDFIAFSRDRHAGPDNSIWRTGSKAGRERTLATWIVLLPRDEPPEIFIRLANPGESEKCVRLALGGSFWSRANGIIESGNSPFSAACGGELP